MLRTGGDAPSPYMIAPTVAAPAAAVATRARESIVGPGEFQRASSTPKRLFYTASRQIQRLDTPRGPPCGRLLGLLGWLGGWAAGQQLLEMSRARFSHVRARASAQATLPALL